MKLLHSNGVPIGLYFRKHPQSPTSYVIRVIGKGEQTDVGANAECLAECYERAIDKRLAYLGMEGNAEAFTTLASAYSAFLSHYGISVIPVTHYEFQITKGH